jgi:hypothetical protein
VGGVTRANPARPRHRAKSRFLWVTRLKRPPATHYQHEGRRPVLNSIRDDVFYGQPL